MSRVNPASTLLPTDRIKKVQSLDDLGADDFLQFMITQLQQQDPLNPVSNQELVEQISSIRELASTTKLNSTLDSVLVGQNIATAGGLIGKNIKALADDNSEINGKVTSVTVAVDANDATKREIRIHVGEKSVKITNIREIIP
jgi:flagellar basal-body rod modification protein FlgD